MAMAGIPIFKSIMVAYAMKENQIFKIVQGINPKVNSLMHQLRENKSGQLSTYPMAAAGIPIS